MTRCLSFVRNAAVAASLLLMLTACASTGSPRRKVTAAPMTDGPDRIACWIADGERMQPPGDLEEFLVDRLSANGERMAVDPATTHAVLRVLGLASRSAFDPEALQRVAFASRSRWVIWVKLVSRDIQSKKLLSVPYLFNHRRLDEHVFFDVRIYDALLKDVIGSKRLSLSDKGEKTWQVIEDERFDPVYNNDPVELHERQRRLDWQSAAAISGYSADVFRSPQLAARTEDAIGRQRAVKTAARQDLDPVAHPSTRPK